MVIGSLSSIAANRSAPNGGAAVQSPVTTPATGAVSASPSPTTQPDAASQPAGSLSAAPTAPTRVTGGYISPYLRYDQMAHVAVLFFRDTDTGETKDQIPAERVVEQYRRNLLRLGGGTDTAAGRTDGQKADQKASGNGIGTDGDRPANAGAGVGQGRGTASGVSAGLFAGHSDSGAAGGAPTGDPATALPRGPSASGLPNAAVTTSPGPTGGAPGGLVSLTV
ncbi:hypothetical protein [Azospirillum canadense]|uniref:hypothetical protein n=1 Tax=Azospirillum canadense TaxID=403962 RepID=UPI002227AEB1|nr:hypothetical protein [Azospirillum canadense]MCW2242617.1 hypothetical protein [Azospirillum canadense]